MCAVLGKCSLVILDRAGELLDFDKGMAHVDEDAGIFQGFTNFAEDLNRCSIVFLVFNQSNGNTLSSIGVARIKLQSLVKELDGSDISLCALLFVLIGISAHLSCNLQEEVAHTGQ